MATQTPFPTLVGLLAAVQDKLPPPPAWLVGEVQHRIVLLLNHILMQEPEAMARLKRQAGKRVLARWQRHAFALVATPAGLLDRVPESASEVESAENTKAATKFDLTLIITEPSAIALAQTALRGDKPTISIAGDVQLAAEVNWLIDHVRWDVEEDLSRIVGDAPAHMVGQAMRRVAQSLREFVGKNFAGDIARAAADKSTGMSPSQAAAGATGGSTSPSSNDSKEPSMTPPTNDAAIHPAVANGTDASPPRASA